jgi:hypothetical protein
MKYVSNETISEKAIQLTIMDAIEKGHTNIKELQEYMTSDVFLNSVSNYKTLLNQSFN